MKGSSLVLFICAGLILSGGAILGGSSAWSLLRMSYYFWTTDLGIELGSTVMFLAGALLCLPTCWLATIVPYHPKSLSLVGTLIVLVIASMMMLSLGLTSVSGLSRAVREPDTLNSSMLRAMTHVSHDHAIRGSFASMQMELKCCGVQSYSDWYRYRLTLPPSCCGRVANGMNADQCDKPLYSIGCLRPALMELRGYANALAILASAIIAVLSVALFSGSYILATSVLERRELRSKTQQALRIACLPQPQPLFHPQQTHAPQLYDINPAVTSPMQV